MLPKHDDTVCGGAFPCSPRAACAAEKTQWLKQLEAATQARVGAEARTRALEDEASRLRQQAAALTRERDELAGRHARAEQDLAESARHLVAARGDYERARQQKAGTEPADVTKIVWGTMGFAASELLLAAGELLSGGRPVIARSVLLSASADSTNSRFATCRLTRTPG